MGQGGWVRTQSPLFSLFFLLPTTPSAWLGCAHTVMSGRAGVLWVGWTGGEAWEGLEVGERQRRPCRITVHSLVAPCFPGPTPVTASYSSTILWNYQRSPESPCGKSINQHESLSWPLSNTWQGFSHFLGPHSLDFSLFYDYSFVVP